MRPRHASTHLTTHPQKKIPGRAGGGAGRVRNAKASCQEYGGRREENVRLQGKKSSRIYFYFCMEKKEQRRKMLTGRRMYLWLSGSPHGCVAVEALVWRRFTRGCWYGSVWVCNCNEGSVCVHLTGCFAVCVDAQSRNSRCGLCFVNM